jgi:endonuclease/exonuclease/phosphatase family metal-dependent hydrolase
MRIVGYNIQFGRGKDGKVDLARIAGEVADADVIALQEVDRYWSRSGACDQVAELSAHLPDHYWIYGPGLDLDADSAGADTPDRGRRRQFGNMLLSRLPFLSSRMHLLPKHALHEKLSLQRCALEGLIACPSGPVRVYSIHLAHVSSLERQDQAARILEIHRAAPGEGAARSGSHDSWDADGPPPPATDRAILLGDFNMEPGSAEYGVLAGYDDPRHGQITRQDAFVDAWLASGGDPDAGFTKFEPERDRRIDFAFVSPNLAGRIASVRVDATAVGSDHQPVWLDIDL